MVFRCSLRATVVLAGVFLSAWAAVAHAQTIPGGLEGLSAGGVDQAPAGGPALARSLLKASLGQSFAVADLNRDGLADVAVVDFLTDSLTVLLGEASGGFAGPTTVATGRGPRAVVAADFDGDGVVDLGVGEFLSGIVRIFAGQGDGRFQAAQALRIGQGVSSLAAHDVDSDGRVDLAVAGTLSGTIGVLKNGAGTSFEWTRVARVRAPTLLLFQDVNRDGTQDLVAIDAEGRKAWMFAGDWAGTFQDAYVVESSAIDALVDASLDAPLGTGVGRLTNVAGDGQALEAGSTAREPLMVLATDFAGAASAGEAISFSRVAGRAEILGALAVGSDSADARVTDESGQAFLDLRLPPFPDVTVVLASLPPDQVTAFRILSQLQNDEIARLIAGLPQEPGSGRALLDAGELLWDAVRRLRQGDPVLAIRDLTAIVDRLDTESSAVTPADATGPVTDVDLVRRFLNQVLLLGSSSDVPDGEPIECDLPLTRTIAAVDEIDRFTFDGVAGELLHITIGNQGGTSGFGPQWRLLGPDGSAVAGCDTFSTGDRECTMPTAGAYAIEAEDGGFNATGTYSLQIQRLTASERCGTAIACDVPETTTISAYADTDLHQFDGVAGELLHITIGNQGGTSGFGPQWRLLGPDGSAVAGCDTFSTGDRECTMPTVGAYAIEAEDGGFNATGTYSLQIQRLTASERCGTAIACDVPETTTISAYADTDLHQFDGVAGELLHITIGNQGGTSGFGPQWRLLGPDGSAVAGCDTFSTGDRECTMPTVGAYAIEAEDGGFNATGTYSLQIQRLTASERCGTAIACDVPETTTISAYADTDLHQFDGVAGELLHITIGNQGGTSGFGPQWRLLGPDGSAVAGCDTFSTGDRVCSLPPPPVCTPSNGCSFAGEPYAIEVEDGGFNATGTYSLHIQRLSAPRRCGVTLFCDVGATTTLSAVADTDIFELNGHQDEMLHITIGNRGGTSGFGPQWRLLGPNGSGVTGCDTFTGAARDCMLPLAGAYAIEVEDGGFNATGTYQLTTVSSLQLCPPLEDIGPALIATGPDKDVLPVAGATTVTVEQRRPRREPMPRQPAETVSPGMLPEAANRGSGFANARRRILPAARLLPRG